MTSYTPQAVAMMLLRNQTDENKILQKTVDAFVKRLNF